MQLARRPSDIRIVRELDLLGGYAIFLGLGSHLESWKLLWLLLLLPKNYKEHLITDTRTPLDITNNDQKLIADTQSHGSNQVSTAGQLK